ncbi:MAG: hypothetical protein JWN04_1704 [Myxococcaceae bacterium]|nr:hypothetical protein [Myxococcaceae bacterium]
MHKVVYVVMTIAALAGCDRAQGYRTPDRRPLPQATLTLRASAPAVACPPAAAPIACPPPAPTCPKTLNPNALDATTVDRTLVEYAQYQVAICESVGDAYRHNARVFANRGRWEAISGLAIGVAGAALTGISGAISDHSGKQAMSITGTSVTALGASAAIAAAVHGSTQVDAFKTGATAVDAALKEFYDSAKELSDSSCRVGFEAQLCRLRDTCLRDQAGAHSVGNPCSVAADSKPAQDLADKAQAAQTAADNAVGTADEANEAAKAADAYKAYAAYVTLNPASGPKAVQAVKADSADAWLAQLCSLNAQARAASRYSCSK